MFWWVIEHDTCTCNFYDTNIYIYIYIYINYNRGGGGGGATSCMISADYHMGLFLSTEISKMGLEFRDG